MLKEILRKIIEPSEYVEDIFSIDINHLKEKGIKVLLLDLDNTVLPANEQQLSIRVQAWVESVRSFDIKVILLSNHYKNERINRIAQALKVDAYYFVCKPFSFVVKRIIEKDLQLKTSEVVIIGDQLLSDVLLGNWLETYTILTKNCDTNKNEPDARIGIFKQAKTRILEEMLNKK